MVTVESYDGKMVKVPEEMKEEYERNQRLIKIFIAQGKTKEEIFDLIKKEENK